MPLTREILENLYAKYNRREYAHPDPVEFLYNYPKIEDREIAGLVAASLAYGNVKQILRSVEKILKPMGESPYEFVIVTSPEEFAEIYRSFKHRFTTGAEIAKMLEGIKNAIAEFGSLRNCFLDSYSQTDENILPALAAFTQKISCAFDTEYTYLLPSPEKKSACKRMNLYLKWMVRKDEIDPGGWNDIPPSKLIIPLDTHMHRIALSTGLTVRKQANLRTAIEITGAFTQFSPDDPAKYDFALTRLGIRKDTDVSEVIGLV